MPEDPRNFDSVILIVDDQVSDIQLLGEAARGLGVTHFAADGRQALELARRIRPDVVLLDIEMPGMDGFEVCQALMADAKLSDAAVIFVTAYDQVAHELRALQMGGVDFITKPMNLPVARARIRTHARLRHMAKILANQDPLTNLPNRALLGDRMAQAIEGARCNQQRVGLLLLDLDNFKAINDAEGHSLGDAILQETALRLSRHCRAMDTVCRPGGDEFAVLLPEVHSLEAIGDFAARVQAALGEPYVIRGTSYHLTASIGISLYPDDSDGAEDLYRHADAAMYQAKAAGRNGYSFFSADIESRMRARHLLERHMRLALEMGVFEVFYQAKVHAATRAIVGVEALIRWRDGEGRLVPPAEFIPLAEETGLIVPIGQQILLRACQDARAWNDAGHPLTVSVNISAVQFRNENFVGQVAEILAQTRMQPGNLELEITEGVLASDRYASRQTLAALRDLGVRIAIDDFGTGYSSLAYLKRFPVNVLKIDQSFVRDMLQDRSDSAIIEAIIKLAQALDLELVAEGVECPNQESALVALGCPVMQGYLYCRPVPRDDMSRLLADGLQP
ncbi:diguanylate cyclase (GGDEF) domain-containing protein [Pseudomonas delhiensis]|uniref:Diguanylate cyclase (GGDEF) domain-containing protein n=1 Tax=Pseudomonas delhiensis TaxID=366289 RepID=A0A239KG14_9PSED|nr:MULTISPECIES: EAL domain-containing protein [Pseudomonas]PWU25845.1 GGDEF domain-containing response regulator [Pseudomonas sp. RW407]SDJ18348.1 diguanylate cyclase (GGDEF) domain-containing protein [Pseudomonas delhiensis]SNT17267.1 diguanylate cyclase (GGDEF) domain-containing protein [Pseudomonas delhiensis]